MSINVEAEKKAYQKFIAAGMTPQGACGLIGNLEAESDGFVPSRVEYLCLKRLKENGKTYTDETYTAAVDSGALSCEDFLHPLPGKQYGYGLAQWTSPGRKSGLWSLAKGKGVSITDLDMQIEYLLSELKSSYSSVLSALKTATSIRSASDVVLKKFEIPADTSESVCAARAARGQAFYDTYVKSSTTKEATSVGVRMSNCGHDENNKYTGGTAGDQTGTEWYLRAWYSYPWNYVIRWLDQELADLFADLAVEAAENDKIGYDQGQRDTFWTKLAAAGYRPANIKAACEADCSSGVVALIKAVGYLKGIPELKNCTATYTGNMLAYFQSANGKKYFEVLTGKYLTDSSYAMRGDINLNTAHHTNVTVDNGANAGTRGSGKGTTATSTSSTGGKYMFSVGTVKNGSTGNDVKLLQRLLKSNGFKGSNGKDLSIDGDCGANTVYAIKAYQKKNGLSVDGVAGTNTWKSILLR